VEVTDEGPLVELGLLDALAASTMYSTRGLDRDARAAITRGIELAKAAGSSEYEVRLQGQLNALLIRAGDWDDALKLAELSLAASDRTGIVGRVRAHSMLALSHHCSGNHALAQEHCETGLRLAASSREELMFHFREPQVILTLARTLWLRGHADRAVAMAHEVMREQKALRHPVDRCVALLLCGPLLEWRGDWDEAERLVESMSEHVERYSLASHRGVALALRGILLVKTGRPREGCNVLRMAESKLKAARNASHDTCVSCALAEGLAASRAFDEALVTIESGIAEAKRRGGTWDLPELLRVKAIVLESRSSMGDPQAEEVLAAAIEVARRQGALALELRAMTALARARLRRCGSGEDLRDLADVYAKFTEGFETTDLRQARDLLRGCGRIGGVAEHKA
jgi:tetratricopeptide (TPR) repeat protein